MLLTEIPTHQSIFYDYDLMPCCGKPIKYYKGPQGGLSKKIECAHCGQIWNICPTMHSIEKI